MDGQQHRLFTLWRIGRHVATVGGAACRSLIRRMAGISTTSTRARAWSAFGLEEGGRFALARTTLSAASIELVRSEASTAPGRRRFRIGGAPEAQRRYPASRSIW